MKKIFAFAFAVAATAAPASAQTWASSLSASVDVATYIQLDATNATPLRFGGVAPSTRPVRVSVAPSSPNAAVIPLRWNTDGYVTVVGQPLHYDAIPGGYMPNFVCATSQGDFDCSEGLVLASTGSLEHDELRVGGWFDVDPYANRGTLRGVIDIYTTKTGG